MNTTLEELKDITSECCVTIIMPTHRIFPDTEKDPIELKNAVKEAEQKLFSNYDKQLALSIIDKINALAETINFRENSDCLALFVSEKVSKYVRLPIEVSSIRVLVGKAFETRQLIRAIHRETMYYILTLSREKARLIEALNDNFTKEFGNNFPMANTFDVEVPGGTAELPNGMDSYVREFFTTVDKQLNEIQKENSYPVILCTDESNYATYMDIAQQKELIEGHFEGNLDDEKAQNIIDEVWPMVKKLRDEKNLKRFSELSSSISSGNKVTGMHEIWKAIRQRRGRALFVKRGNFQPR
jgi:hypothetical protein